jgi:uncharacterized protein with von Willebrand factor type A (vWA) domain
LCEADTAKVETNRRAVLERLLSERLRDQGGRKHSTVRHSFRLPASAGRETILFDLRGRRARRPTAH